MLVDDVTIVIHAGKGGKGAVSFSNVKMTLGPTGGSGGHGASVYLEGIADLGALQRFRKRKVFDAPDGEDGRSKFRDGHVGEDLILGVPRGTVVHDLEKDMSFEITKIGEQILVAKGGNGGRGNFQYKSSKNTSPKQFQSGLPGETRSLRLELKLIADIGLIGLPNVGKSSFLNAMTKAQSRVANYPFTTLEPHLGTYYGLILADIPGLIEGASSGKGLGVKFLRHVERTRILFHFIDANSEDPVKDYYTIRRELEAYNPALLEKPEYVFIAKSDTVSEERMKEVMKDMKARVKAKHILPMSILDDGKIAVARKALEGILTRE